MLHILTVPSPNQIRLSTEIISETKVEVGDFKMFLYYIFSMHTFLKFCV